MFAFSFALIPFYNVLCNAFGINGKTNITSIANKNSVDTSRTITIQFLANTNNKLPWDFYPKIKQITVHPGETKKIVYIAKNNSDQIITAQAVPSITPGDVARYFKKIDCFCFRRQTLQPHQKIEMPVVFFVDPALPKKINELTLSYSLYQLK